MPVSQFFYLKKSAIFFFPGFCAKARAACAPDNYQVHHRKPPEVEGRGQEGADMINAPFLFSSFLFRYNVTRFPYSYSELIAKKKGFPEFKCRDFSGIFLCKAV